MKKFFPSLVSCINLLLLFVILWKGGKALDATWILASGASMLAMILSYQIFWRKESITFSKIQLSVIILSLGFLALTILSFLSSKTQNYGFDEVLQTASYVLLLITLLGSPSLTASLQKKIPRTIAIALLLACGVGVVLYLTQPLTRFVGTFFDYRFHTDYWPNAFAEFFLLAWPCALFALFSNSTIEQKMYSNKRWMRLAVLGFLFGCFFLTYSRGAFLSFILQMIAGGSIVAFLVKPSRQIIRTILRDGVIIVCISLLFFFSINAVRSQYFPVESVIKKAQFESQEGKSSVSERSQFFSQAWVLAKEKPLLGWGPYSFRFVQPRLQQGVLATSDHPHNVLLKLMMERGIPSAIVFMIVLMLCTTTLVQKISDSKKLSHDRVLLGVFLISGLGVFAHNMIDYNLQFVGITLPMILMMACSISSESSEKKYDGKYPAMILMLLSILLGSVTLIEGIFLTLSSIERHGGNAYYSESKGMWAMNPEYMNVFNNSVQYSSLFPRDYYLTLFVKARSDGGRYGLYEPLEEYAKKNNEDYRFWKMRCILFAEHGIYNRDEALSACQKAYEQGGKWNDAEVVWRYASALASSMVIGEFEKEYRFEFDTVLNEYAYAILQNSHFIALGENVENTIKLAETLKSIFYPPNKGGPNDWYDRKTIPEDENAYNLLIQEIKEHAKKERSHLTSREERIR